MYSDKSIHTHLGHIQHMNEIPNSSRDIQYQYYALAFIDILGQKEIFAALDGVLLTDNDLRLAQAHKNTVMFVNQMREWLIDFYQSFMAEEAPDGKLKIPSHRMNDFLELRRSNLKYQFYSDFIQVYAPLHDSTFHNRSINGVYGLLSVVGSLMIYALARSRALRGGIDVALGIELENRELYGPVSYKAYHIESSVAEYPRIVIGPNLLEYLQQLSRSVRQFPGQTDDDIRLCKIGADRCNSMICSDDDGKPILDYLSNSFVSKEQLGEAWDDYHALLMMAKKFVHAEAEIRRSDPKLGPRYKRLKRYFQSRSF